MSQKIARERIQRLFQLADQKCGRVEKIQVFWQLGIYRLLER